MMRSDDVFQQIIPHPVTSCVITVYPSKTKLRPLAWLPPHVCEVVISTEVVFRFMTEDHMPPVDHTTVCSGAAKIQLTLPMMWGLW